MAMDAPSTQGHGRERSAAGFSIELISHGLPNGASHGLYWPQNHELAQISIPDLLSVVSRNALMVIPAERCVVFMYDKSANVLSAQVSSASDLQEEEEQSFAPVMGMISACFLQKRCLRMQEPHMHKSFHREYDVPADMEMNSIIVAPVILHHRTIGVIELLNRIDPDVSSPVAEAFHDEPSPRQTDRQGDEEIEIKLTRTKAVQQRPRMGFSSKDEQKMIQFTSHVAQLLDNKLKLLAQGESQAKLREERAKSAMELLNLMNEKLELQTTVVPPLPTPRPKRLSVPVLQLMEMATTATDEIEEVTEPSPMAAVSEEEPTHRIEQEAPPQQPAEQLLCDADMMKVLVGISRTQALFRGNHLRKIHRLSEALNEHKKTRKKVRSAVIIQRAARRFLARRWRKQRRDAILVIIKCYRAFQFRARLAERQEIKKRQKRKRSIVVDSTPASTVTHHKLVESDVEKFRKRFASAVRIQQVVRGHQARQRVKKLVGFKNAARAVKNIVKLQSFMRGTIAKVKVERIRQEKRAARTPHIVCMRVAATDSAPEATALPGGAVQALPSRSCVYPLVNRFYSEVGTCPASPARERQYDGSMKHRRRHFIQRDVVVHGDEDVNFRLESRPLVASPTAPQLENGLRQKMLMPLKEPLVTRASLTRQHPTFVFDVDPKRVRRCPPGVQHADDWLPRARRLKNTAFEDERETEDAQPPHHSPRLSVNQLPLLTRMKSPEHLTPRLRSPMPPLSNQLQVCFVPAESSRRRSLVDRSGAMITARPSTEQQPPPRIPRRPLTTR